MAPDVLSLIAISSLAYIASVALHEHLGHTAACVLLGGRPAELGAFYVDCDDARLSDLAVRSVALAGPVISLVVGLIALGALDRPPAGVARYFTWLLGSIGLMTGSGYLLFSGVSGLGDLGIESDSVFRHATHPWALRIALTLAGIAGYQLATRYCVQKIAASIPGSGVDRVRLFKRITWISYLSGAAVCLAVGALNPHGLIIVLESSAATSLGGTAGLLFMWHRLGPCTTPGPTIVFSRRWDWIAIALVLIGAYAAVLGPTLHP